ncbi:MAG TPA: hypothetical protein VLC08_06960 [Chitinolyticbacter sp.]|nr:hypothetical protein [Chitinolyticbacter sp.]
MKRVFLLALIALLTGCTTVKKWVYGDPLPAEVKSVRVVAEIGANGDNATALDLVFVYDVNALALLPKTGPEWFAQKRALQASLATGIDVVPLEVPPATVIAAAPMPRRHGKAIGVYAFPNYVAAAGQAVGKLTPFKRATVRLMPDTVEYRDDAN